MYEALELYYRTAARKELLPTALRGGLPKWEYEDALQETFTRACRYWPTFDEERGRIFTWLSSIMRNVVRDYHAERMPRQDDIEFIDEQTPTEFSVFTPHERLLTRRELQREIDKLKNDAHRDLLTKYYGLGLSRKELDGVRGLRYKGLGSLIDRFSSHVKEKYA